MPHDESEQAKRLDNLETFAYGDRDDPNDLGAKGDLKQIKADVGLIQKDVGEIRSLIKWVIGLTMGMVLTAVLSLVIKQ